MRTEPYGPPTRRVTTAPEIFATYLKTKVVRLEKLVERSVDPVDAGGSVSAHGLYGWVQSHTYKNFPRIPARTREKTV